MTAIYIPKPRSNVKSVPAVDLSKYFKKDGTSIPVADISWGSKKLLNLAQSTESNSAITKGYVDTQVIAVKENSNVVSIKSGYLYYFGISIIPDPSLTEYDASTNIVSQINDALKLSSFVCTPNKVKLLKDASINQLYYNTLVDSSFSNTILASELMTNDDISVIMILKNANLNTEQNSPEYISWTRDTTMDFLITINNTTVSGVQT